MQQEPLWIVYNTRNTPNPYRFYRHLTKESAIVEARRLAACNPDETFGVFELTEAFMNPKAIQVPIVKIEDQQRDQCEVCEDDLPF